MATLRVLLSWVAALFGILLLIPILVLGLPFWGIALLTRFTYKLLRHFRPLPTPWQELMQFEPIVGWKPKANLDTHAKADTIFKITTDAQGWRGKTNLAESKIVVFGDSFAFGHGIDDKHFFAELNSNLPVKAIGANGYSMVHELLWMQRMADQISGKLVVWLIYSANDLYENLKPNLEHYRMPFVRAVDSTGEWEIVTNHISPIRWEITSKRDYYARLAEICSSTPLADRVYSAVKFLIRKGSDLCQEMNTPLVVITIPDITQISERHIEHLRNLAPDVNSFAPDLPDIKISQICREIGVPFVALSRHLKPDDYMQRDVHWNENGHRRVADVLEDLYNKYSSSK
jgi:hypothetical protein